jgi:hypothetical protein
MRRAPVAVRPFYASSETLAGLFGVPELTVRRLAEAGQIRRVRVSNRGANLVGGASIYRVKDLKELLDNAPAGGLPEILNNQGGK